MKHEHSGIIAAATLAARGFEVVFVEMFLWPQSSVPSGVAAWSTLGEPRPFVPPGAAWWSC